MKFFEMSQKLSSTTETQVCTLPLFTYTWLNLTFRTYAGQIITLFLHLHLKPHTKINYLYVKVNKFKQVQVNNRSVIY